METIEGEASNIRYSTEVGGTDKGTYTTQIALLDIAGRPVEIKLPESIVITNGDRVLVAGESKRGLLQGLAYNNLTKGVRGKGPASTYWLIGVVFCASIVFIPLGIWLIKTAKKYQHAFDLIDKQPAK